MGKEEKKAGLEQLLNSLIEKGWKPFGMEQYDRFIIESAGDMRFRWKYPGVDGESAFDYNYDYFKIRELVSIDSGLWQFVCENGMVDDGVEYEGYALVDVDGGAIAKHETGCRYLYSNITPEFYIMESALKDESELEEFLLNSIKID